MDLEKKYEEAIDVLAEVLEWCENWTVPFDGDPEWKKTTIRVDDVFNRYHMDREI